MTVSSEVNVYQLALDAVGTRSNISATTENSREAEICSRWYVTVRDHVFRTAFWPSLKKTRRLALLAERDDSADWVAADPDPHWKYAYSIPDDMAAARFLSTYSRFDLSWYNGAQVALQTDQEDAILFYSFKNENPGAWDDGLKMAIITALASQIARPLTGKRSLAADLARQANDFILAARVMAANEVSESYDSMPEWITARGYQDLAPSTRFMMPYSSLLSVTGEIAPSTSRSVV